MSKVIPVTITEFLYLVEYAQEHHAAQNEPIPQVHPAQHGAIKSCLESPFQTWDGKLLYKGFHTKAAILFYLICKNHTLINGNKRLACLTLAYFCHINNHPLGLPQNQFYELAKAVTNSSPDLKDFVVTTITKTLKYICD